MYKIILILAIIFTSLGILDIWSSIAISLFFYYFINFLNKLNDNIAFREFILLLFSINYLFAPAILMNLSDLSNVSFYKIKLSKEEFFQITIPTILLLHLGLFLIKTNVFKSNFELVKANLLANETILKKWVIVGIICSLLIPALVGSEIGFILYLISLIKYVGAFALFSINKKGNKLYILVVFFFELSQSFQRGMFGESAMWIGFFMIFYFYITKPSVYIRTGLIIIGFICFTLFQNSKNDYRSKVWNGDEEGSIETFISSAEGRREGIFDISSIVTSLNRVNQGWILASVVDKMKLTNDFQEFVVINMYLEAALLPRFLAPNKLTSGNREIFNRFSGHTIEQGTSMGLGFFADGYIAFGYWGVLASGLVLGLLFSSIFKFVERWTKISPFFIFFIFPILNYAVRPDCETQTIMGHIVKAIFVYSIIIWFTEKTMKKTLKTLKRKAIFDEEDFKTESLNPTLA